MRDKASKLSVNFSQTHEEKLANHHSFNLIYNWDSFFLEKIHYWPFLHQ